MSPLIFGPDFGSGTLITALACVRSGTRIATPSGEVLGGALHAGDRVLTAFHRSVPVV